MGKDKSLVKTTMREFINEQFASDNMKDLIINALDGAFLTLERQVPQTKKKSETASILDVKPSELISFMKSNDIPNDAYFSCTGNGDDWNDIVLAWEISVPTTEKDKLEFKNRRFHDIAFKSVYDLLTSNGYKRMTERDRGRISFSKSSPHIVMFDKKTVYEMYIDKDFDKLVEYYSLYYVRKEV